MNRGGVEHRVGDDDALVEAVLHHGVAHGDVHNGTRDTRNRHVVARLDDTAHHEHEAAEDI